MSFDACPDFVRAIGSHAKIGARLERSGTSPSHTGGLAGTWRRSTDNEARQSTMRRPFAMISGYCSTYTNNQSCLYLPCSLLSIRSSHRRPNIKVG